MRTHYQAMVFDFDGVLADSVEVKTEAFHSMYKEYGTAIADEVVRFHRANGGTPRREKFRHYQKELLKTTPTEADLDSLGDRFSDLVVDGVIAAPEIPGAQSFLDHWSGIIPLFVDSASPDGELSDILSRRGLSGYFAAAFGSNRSKTENLAAILKEYELKPSKVLFFGDALSDLKAAQACGTDFIGIDFNDTKVFANNGEKTIDVFPDFNSMMDNPRFKSRLGEKDGD